MGAGGGNGICGRSEEAQGSGGRELAEPGQVGREGEACGQETAKCAGPRGPLLGSGLHTKGRGGALTGELALTSVPEGGLADGGAWGSEA